MGAFRCALGVVGLIRGRCVNWNSPWGSSGSSAVAWFIGVRLGGRRVHPGSLRYALGVVVFIRCRWVNWGASWGSSGSSGVVGFLEVLPRGRPVRTGSLGSLGCALEFVVFLIGPWVN